LSTTSQTSSSSTADQITSSTSSASSATRTSTSTISASSTTAQSAATTQPATGRNSFGRRSPQNEVEGSPPGRAR
uniref:Merozoite surface protein 2 n=1 Tax=Heligmosomoides polygyrus TaxID=6339 RepID=A0A183GJ93_HELPZ